MAKCPFCDTRASSVGHLKTHLAGRPPGHELPGMDAQEIAERVFAGSYRPGSSASQPAGPSPDSDDVARSMHQAEAILTELHLTDQERAWATEQAKAIFTSVTDAYLEVMA